MLVPLSLALHLAAAADPAAIAPHLAAGRDPAAIALHLAAGTAPAGTAPATPPLPDLRLVLPEPGAARPVLPTRGAIVASSAGVLLGDLGIALGATLTFGACLFGGSQLFCNLAPVGLLAGALFLVPALAAGFAHAVQPEGSFPAAYRRAVVVNLAVLTASAALAFVAPPLSLAVFLVLHLYVLPHETAAANAAAAPPQVPRPVRPEPDPAEPHWGL
jgi:hypothetical protein